MRRISAASALALQKHGPSGAARPTQMQALPQRISTTVGPILAPGLRLAPGRVPVTPIALALSILILNSGLASASVSSSLERANQARLQTGTDQIIMAAAAPDAVSGMPRSRPSSEKAETPDSGAPTPVAKPAETRKTIPAQQPASTRALSTATPSMPRPVPRPETLATRAASSQTQRATVPSPAKIAAPGSAQSALANSTSLLGVLETGAGREALLRTGSGQVVKVKRGNVVEGWQVSSIDRDTIRLTRAGETRTLRILSN